MRALKEDTERFDEAPDELVEFMPLFGEMIDSTPALRAAWLELHDRLAKVARDELAAQAGVDPRDPGADRRRPRAGRPGRGGVGLAHAPHPATGCAATALRGARGGRPGTGRAPAGDRTVVVQPAARRRAKTQAMEAARAAEEARAQVIKALRQARAAWDEVRSEAAPPGTAGRQARRQGGPP